MSDQTKSIFLHTKKVHVISQNMEDIDNFKDQLYALGVSLEDVDEIKRTVEIEFQDELGQKRTVSVVEIQIPTLICIWDLWEISEVHGRPDLSAVFLQNGEQRIIAKPHGEMISLMQKYFEVVNG